VDEDLIGSWEISMRAERLAAGTVRTYLVALRPLRTISRSLDYSLSARLVPYRLRRLRRLSIRDAIPEPGRPTL
jgi:hypothetical protein